MVWPIAAASARFASSIVERIGHPCLEGSDTVVACHRTSRCPISIRKQCCSGLRDRSPIALAALSHSDASATQLDGVVGVNSLHYRRSHPIASSRLRSITPNVEHRANPDATLGEDDIAVAVGLKSARAAGAQPLHSDRAHAHTPDGAVLIRLRVLRSPRRHHLFVSTLIGLSSRDVKRWSIRCAVSPAFERVAGMQLLSRSCAVQSRPRRPRVFAAAAPSLSLISPPPFQHPPPTWPPHLQPPH